MALGNMTPLLEQNDRVCLQWPVNILTKEPDSIRLCKKAWIACLSPLLTTPVYDAVEACNFYDEDSTIATIDDALLADCGNLLRAKAIQLVREILTTSDAQWSIKYIRIVYEISQLQAAADQHLALDMARMGLGALGTGLRLRGKDARQCVLDRVRLGRSSTSNNNTTTGAGQPQEAPIPASLSEDDDGNLSNSSATPRTCNALAPLDNDNDKDNDNAKDDGISTATAATSNENDDDPKQQQPDPHPHHRCWSFRTTTVQGNAYQSRRNTRASTSSGILRSLQRHRNTHENDADAANSSEFHENRRRPKVKFEFAAPRGPNAERRSNATNKTRSNTNTTNIHMLTGSQIDAQMQAWSSYGCLEPSAASSIRQIAALDDAAPLVDHKNRVFVLLGATSELGPFELLSKLGATIAVVARPGCLSKIQKLVYDAKYTTHATLLLPVRPRHAAVSAYEHEHEQDKDGTNYMDFPQHQKQHTNYEDANDDIDDADLGDCIDRAGADIINDTPELAEWIAGLCPTKQLVLVNLANLGHGEDHVLVSAGMDLICEAVCQQRRDACLAYYISPTTAHCVSEDASMDSERRAREAPLWQKLLSVGSSSNSGGGGCGFGFGFDVRFQQQAAGRSWPKLPNTGLRVCNGLARYQGHFYALAKTSQMWRCMLARSEGHLVSANLGPSSRTDSMISYKFVSLALEGMQIVPPLVTFDVEPAKMLMAALMLWDLNYDASSANPNIDLEHPMCLFLENAVHGGTWRCPYTVDSMGRVSYIVGHFREAGRSPLGSLSKAVLQVYSRAANGTTTDDDDYRTDDEEEDGASIKSSYSRGSRGRVHVPSTGSNY